jgi:Mrp family chromosome partitioning ATPase
MAAAADGVLLVAVADKTERAALSSVLSTLQRLRANVVGIVANAIAEDTANRYHYHYHYYASDYHNHGETQARAASGDD